MKSQIVLEMYYRLTHGQSLAVQEITQEFNLCDRTFYRYVHDLRIFFEKHAEKGKLQRDKATGRYSLS